jgi:hypothetical protein
MMDNFYKIIMLTPDLIFDTIVGDMQSEDLLKVFNEYKRLEDISINNIFENEGRLAFLEIQNSLFDFITSRVLINKGRIKLLTYMQVFLEERKIVLCLPYNEFIELLKEYRVILSDKKEDLILEINQITNELSLLNKINLEK